MTGCGVPGKKATRKPLPIIGADLIQRGTVEAVGIGVPTSESGNPQKRQKSSFLNAYRMAQKELESIIGGFALADGMLLRDYLARDEKLRKRLTGALKRCDVIKKEWTRDDGCTVRLRIRKDQIEKKIKLKFR